MERVVKEAFYIARTNRPGPVVVDLLKDILDRSIDFIPDNSEVFIHSYRVMKGFNAGQVINVVELIKKPGARCSTPAAGLSFRCCPGTARTGRKAQNTGYYHLMGMGFS